MNKLELVSAGDMVKIYRNKRGGNKRCGNRSTSKKYMNKFKRDIDKSRYKMIIRSLEQADYREDNYSALYLGRYIEKYVQMVFNADIVTRKGLLHEERPIDWIVNRRGKTLKVKHVASRLFSYRGYLCWSFKINRNEKVDAFILSAFGNTEFEPKYLWLIMSKEIFETRHTKREFWDRDKLEVNEKAISIMSRYELKKELEELKCIMEKVKSERQSEEYKNNIHHIITRKQREIFDNTGERVTRRYIIEKAIIAGIDKIKV